MRARAAAPIRYRDANARNSADHPRNESTLRRAISPGRFSLFLSRALASVSASRGAYRSLSLSRHRRRHRLDVFIIAAVFPSVGT